MAVNNRAICENIAVTCGHTSEMHYESNPRGCAYPRCICRNFVSNEPPERRPRPVEPESLPLGLE